MEPTVSVDDNPVLMGKRSKGLQGTCVRRRTPLFSRRRDAWGLWELFTTAVPGVEAVILPGCPASLATFQSRDAVCLLNGGVVSFSLNLFRHLLPLLLLRLKLLLLLLLLLLLRCRIFVLVLFSISLL